MCWGKHLWDMRRTGEILTQKGRSPDRFDNGNNARALDWLVRQGLFCAQYTNWRVGTYIEPTPSAHDNATFFLNDSWSLKRTTEGYMAK